MPDVEVDRDIPIDREVLTKIDNRGRITIPSYIRERNGIDPDEEDYWVELTVHRVETRKEVEDDGGEQ